MTWYEILPRILNMSLTASVIICFVLLGRLILKRSPKIYSYVLWSVVLFRLLCPVTLSAPFSVLGLLDTPVVEQSTEDMLGLCEQCLCRPLEPQERSIIDRCVRDLYREIARSKEKHVPVMSEFYEMLRGQKETVAEDVALAQEVFVDGSLNIFNHQTNVNMDNRFMVYGIRDLGADLSPVSMLVMMEAIKQKITDNSKIGKATWLFIDEFHVLLNSEFSAKYLQQLWKKVRKQGGLCTGITQNITDLLQNYVAATMISNSEFVVLLKQANLDSTKVSEVIGVSEAQLKFVSSSPAGMGLIKCGNIVIPFDNRISKGNELYMLFNTNMHEKAEWKNEKITVDK